MRFLKYIIGLIVLVVIYFGVDYYVDNKVDNSRSEAYAALKSFFKDKRMYVDLLYVPCGFNYKETAIPQPETPSVDEILHSSRDEYLRKKQRLKQIWKRKYGQFFKMYKLDIFPPPYESDNVYYKSGWALKIIEQKDLQFSSDYIGGIIIYNFYPSEVAYKKEGDLYWSFTTIEKIVLEAFEFYTKNEYSRWYPYYLNGCTYNIISQMKNKIDNEYYSFEECKKGEPGYIRWGESHPFSGDAGETSSVDAGSMYSDFYEVFCKKTQPNSYDVKFIGNDVVKKEKYKLMAIWAVLSIIIMIGCKKIMD